MQSVTHCAKCGDEFTPKSPAYGYRGEPYKAWYCDRCYYSLSEKKIDKEGN